MTDVSNLEAGPELDRIVGEKVMGCHVKKNHKGCYDLVIPGGVSRVDWVEIDGAWSGMPNYSTDIAAAWEIVERLKGPGRPFRMWTSLNDEFYEATFDNGLTLGMARTAPLAICLAARKIVEK